MRIGVDGQLIIRNRTGMGVYAFNILKYWEKHEDEVYVYIPDNPSDDLLELATKNNYKIVVVKNKNYLIWEQIILPKVVIRDRIDVLWCPYCTAPLIPPCPIIVVIHDTIYMEMALRTAPTVYKKMGLIYRKLIVPIAAKRASLITTVSEYSKKQLCRHFSGLAGKIVIIPNGAEVTEGLSKNEKDAFFIDNDINGKYILGFGPLEARKNSITLIKAYKRLDESIRDSYKLVLFGFRGYECSEEKKYIEENDLKERVVVLGYISDKEKKTLYENCSVFVFPSISEGFGIPILEAFEAEIPVISSDVTSLPEVAGKGAFFVSPLDIEEISEGIMQVLNDSKMAAELVYEGNKQLQKYSWRRSSELTWKMLHDV